MMKESSNETLQFLTNSQECDENLKHKYPNQTEQQVLFANPLRNRYQGKISSSSPYFRETGVKTVRGVKIDDLYTNNLESSQYLEPIQFPLQILPIDEIYRKNLIAELGVLFDKIDKLKGSDLIEDLQITDLAKNKHELDKIRNEHIKTNLQPSQIFKKIDDLLMKLKRNINPKNSSKFIAMDMESNQKEEIIINRIKELHKQIQFSLDLKFGSSNSQPINFIVNTLYFFNNVTVVYTFAFSFLFFYEKIIEGPFYLAAITMPIIFTLKVFFHFFNFILNFSPKRLCRAKPYNIRLISKMNKKRHDVCWKILYLVQFILITAIMLFGIYLCYRYSIFEFYKELYYEVREFINDLEQRIKQFSGVASGLWNRFITFLNTPIDEKEDKKIGMLDTWLKKFTGIFRNMDKSNL